VSDLSDRTLDHLREVVEWPDLSETRYELRRELDRGGMGVVYAAHDRELHREVALKVLATAVADADSATRLRREARIIAGLEHPGIVPVHDVGTLPDGRVFYAMKLVSGQRLDALVRDRPPLTERLRVFLRVCEPVAFAHAHGVIHRDLKPENVMVGPFGEVLVMDWGVAKKLGPDEDGERSPGGRSPAVAGGTAHGTVVGTPAWMAPEQARGDVEHTDARADVYALGAILYFLLTGRAPGAVGGDVAEQATRTWVGYAGDRPMEVLPVRRLDPEVPRPLEAICRKALAAEPQGRYATAADLAGDIASFTSGSSVSAFPEGPWRRTLRFGAKYRTPILLVAAYVAMRVLLLLFFRM
jgi:serine/threonine protein kinase